MKCKRFLSAIMVIIIMIASASCNYNQDYPLFNGTENENVIQSESFYVSSESTELETSVTGTIFLSGDDGVVEHVQIVALIEIDPDDWGGVAFYIPYGWEITGITSSYPEGEESDPAEFLAVGYTTDPDFYDFKFKEWIEIGMVRDIDNNYPPIGGGGTGTIVIELDITDEASTDTFSIQIAVGCDEKDGVQIVHPDYITVEIPLSQE